LISDLIDKIPSGSIQEIADLISMLIEQIRRDIPEKRRVGIGRYTITKELGVIFYSSLEGRGIQQLHFAEKLFAVESAGPFARSLAVQLACQHGLASRDVESAKTLLGRAAGDEDWIVRECSSGFIRALIKEYPDSIRAWYLEMVDSKDPNTRRFVSESLRPVAENRWFHNQPEYALEVIRHLFQESAPYPRTSVGNSLSDWMRVDADKAWPIISKLAASGDPNSHWIAYRACRNFVKKEPRLVMETLGVSEYKYKNRRYSLADYQ